MAITSLITAGTAAADAELDIVSTVTVVCTKLVNDESVVIKVKGLAADLEQAVNTRIPLVLTRENNAVQLVGPCIYHLYKSITAASLGVGYYA